MEEPAANPGKMLLEGRDVDCDMVQARPTGGESTRVRPLGSKGLHEKQPPPALWCADVRFARTFSRKLLNGSD